MQTQGFFELINGFLIWFDNKNIVDRQSNDIIIICKYNKICLEWDETKIVEELDYYLIPDSKYLLQINYTAYTLICKLFLNHVQNIRFDQYKSLPPPVYIKRLFWYLFENFCYWFLNEDGNIWERVWWNLFELKFWVFMKIFQ